MADRSKYYTGSQVSRHLSAENRAWDEVVVQSGRPVTDAALNLKQEIGQELSRVLAHANTPSGWLKGPGASDPSEDFTFPGSSALNSLDMRARQAIVAGIPIKVEYTNTDTPGSNRITLSPASDPGTLPPTTKRSDFVFLEVWRALISPDERSTGEIQLLDNNTVAGTTVTVAGVPLEEGVAFAAAGTLAGTVANLRAAIDSALSPGTVRTYIDPPNPDTIIIQAAASGTPGNGITLSTSDPAVWSLTPMTTVASDTPSKPDPDHIYVHGNTLSSVDVALPDDLEDPAIRQETTKRVQIQYRIRHTGEAEGVSFINQPDGFSNANVLAQGTQSSPVAGYRFVPADNNSSAGNSDASQYGTVDDGLWIAGDGSETAAADLGTVDGFVYAIPLAFVYRRNTGPFDPVNNTVGANGFADGPSDHPEGVHHDVLVEEDLHDLRRHVYPAGTDLSADLQRQMQLLFDGSLLTWAVDGSDKQTIGNGSGTVGTRYLVCNEIGRDNPVPPDVGDTPRGVLIGEFDHVRRRFSDHPVVERVVFAFTPDENIGDNPGKYSTASNPGWREDDQLVLDLTNLDVTTLGDWSPASSSGSETFVNTMPTGTRITNVLSMYHDDGGNTTAVEQKVQAKLIQGIGSSQLEITLDENPTEMVWDSATPPVAGGPHPAVGAGVDGSTRRIFVEVEITYPIGSGLTDTPDGELSPDPATYPHGPLIENNPAQQPADLETLIAPRFREGKREVALEYVQHDGSDDPLTDYIISRDANTVVLPRRVSDNMIPTIDGAPVDTTATEFGSSSRVVVPDSPLAEPQMAVLVEYHAQDAIPNYGTDGYQISVYYRTVAPQTLGTKEGTPSLPASVTVEPLVMSQSVWTGHVGSGSVESGYPYAAPLDQIAMNKDSQGLDTSPQEWYFAAQARISVDDFDAETGLLHLHAMVPMDGTGTFEFSSPATDSEFRAHYQVTDPNSYRPTVFAQPLSGASRHKVWLPFLARMTGDDPNGLWRKNEVVLAVISRFAALDDENNIRFTDTGDDVCVALYRTRGLLLLAGE